MPHAEALVRDAARTPGGRGKSPRSLREVTQIDLRVDLIERLRERNPGLDVERIDDVVLGVVIPIDDQGADIAKTAAVPDTAAGVPLNRIDSVFCIGFPSNRGEAARSFENNPGGMAASVPRADERADAYGECFRPTAWMRRGTESDGGLAA